eukprot:GHVP01056333.1.p1 GENE.GHVP01056333.1~~GHVP01056333.1.p1  ORF type:complete len:133 (-),score=21.53 GHVP01056333.1:137-535(-)
MHPRIASLSSYLFYDGEIQSGITIEDRKFSDFNFPWPSKEFPVLFDNSLRNEELATSGNTYINIGEVIYVLRFINLLIDKGATVKNIGIITTYEGQREFLTKDILSELRDGIEKESIEVANVDSFQGREKRI